MPYNFLRMVKARRWSGTTCATADTASKKKLVIPEVWRGAKRLVFVDGPQGEGVYLEGGTGGGDLGRDGVNFPAAEVVAEAGQATWLKTINLDTNVWVVAYDDTGDSSKAKAVVVTLSGETFTAGTAVEINGAATDGIDLTKLSSTTFAVAYGDNGGDDYLCARIGTVTASTQTVAFGTEKELTAAAIDITDGNVGVCEPRSGVLAFAYQLASDSKGYIIAATYSGTTISDPGSAVEFEAGETVGISMDAIANGRVVIGYSDGGNSDYLTTAVCTVLAAAVCVAGTAEAHSAAAATSIEVHKASENRGILSWIDSGDYHMLAFDIGTSGTTLAEGADATAAGTVLTVSSTLFNPTQGILAYENDAAGDYGTVLPFSITWAAIGSGGTISFADQVDIFAEASTQTVVVAANDENQILIAYDDAGDSNKTKVVYGKYYDTNGVIDIRASGASASYYVTLFPIFDRGEFIETTSI